MFVACFHVQNHIRKHMQDCLDWQCPPTLAQAKREHQESDISVGPSLTPSKSEDTFSLDTVVNITMEYALFQLA